MAEDSSLRELVEGAGVGMVLGIIGMGLAFVFNVFAARYYGPDAFGQFTLAKTILLFTSMVAGMGVKKGVEKYIPMYRVNDDGASLAGYLYFVFSYPLGAAVLLAISLFVFAESITAFFGYPSTFVTILRVVSLTVPFRVLQQILTRIFLAHKDVFSHEFNSEVVENVVLLLGFGLIFWYDLDVFYLVVTMGASFALASFWNLGRYLVAFEYDVLEGVEDRRFDLGEWFGFSLPLFFSGVLSFLVSWTDNFFIGRYLDADSLGVYGVVFSFALVLKLFHTVFNNIFRPIVSEKFEEGDKEGIAFLYRKSSAWVFALTLPVFLVFFVYAEEVLRLVYGEAYAVGFLPLMIVSTGFLFNVSVGLAGQILYVYGDSAKIFYSNLVAVLANILLNFFLVDWYGIIGAAISTALTIVLQDALSLYYALQKQRLSFDWVYMTKFVMAGLPAAYLSSLFFRADLALLLQVVLSGFTYLLLYGGLLLALRVFREEDLAVLEVIEDGTGLDLSYAKQIVAYCV